jgi:hypothetical protein
MKSSRILGATVLLLIIVTGVLIISTFNGLAVSALRAQVTSTPLAEDQTVIGSTNGIVVLGFLIVLIVTVPLIFRRRKK